MGPQWDLYVPQQFLLKSRFTTTMLRGPAGDFDFSVSAVNFTSAEPEDKPRGGPTVVEGHPPLVETMTAAAAAWKRSPT